MKTSGRFFLMAALLTLILAGRLPAQTFTLLHDFTSVFGANATNSDGATPAAGLILAGNRLYGTAKYGGNSGWGTVFSVNSDGSDFTASYHFTGGIDGANPSAELMISDNTLYGTANTRGGFGSGTVFALNTDGSGFLNLHSFSAIANNSFGVQTNSEGAHPLANLILSGNSLYGTANDGGTSGHGTVFSMQTNGTGFVSLHSFSSGSGGAFSAAGLTISGNIMNGANYGNLGSGTIFAIDTDGNNFTNNYAFTSRSPNGTNSDGANPHSSLLLFGNTLYGTTVNGGSSGNGTVFSINADGTGFSNLHSFAAGAYNSSGLYTNSDGAHPSAGLVLSGSKLYGTANAGGNSGQGAVFVLNTNGTGFSNLYSFTGTPPYPQAQTNSDGAQPFGGLVLSGNALYGTTAYGGSSGNGTVFRLSFAPHLAISRSATNIILSWPANIAGFDFTGFTLQSTPALTSTFTNIPGATNPYTNSISDAQQFYRLSPK